MQVILMEHFIIVLLALRVWHIDTYFHTMKEVSGLTVNSFGY